MGGWGAGRWAYLTNTTGGGEPVVLVDPGAFGAAGAKYALATAGGDEPMGGRKLVRGD